MYCISVSWLLNTWNIRGCKYIWVCLWFIISFFYLWCQSNGIIRHDISIVPCRLYIWQSYGNLRILIHSAIYSGTYILFDNWKWFAIYDKKKEITMVEDCQPRKIVSSSVDHNSLRFRARLSKQQNVEPQNHNNQIAGV